MLLIDAGNTRLKWAWLSAGSLSGHGAVRAGAELPDAVQRAAPQPVLVGSVAGDAFDAQLARRLAAAGHGPVAFATVEAERFGLRLAYRDPTRLGVDRWLAMLGACGMHTGPLCVADAGTALTLDAVDAHGRHLGGLIAPGTATMMRAMLNDTARIADANPVASLTADDFFAADTGAAVAAGAAFAAAALIDRAATRLGALAEASVTTLLTGGEAPALERLVTVDTSVVPDLVLRGLARLAGEGAA